MVEWVDSHTTQTHMTHSGAAGLQANPLAQQHGLCEALPSMPAAWCESNQNLNTKPGHLFWETDALSVRMSKWPVPAPLRERR